MDAGCGSVLCGKGALVEACLLYTSDPQVANWITGTNDIEAEWDAYVASLENAGIQQSLDIMQKAFDTYLEAIGN